jgi:hypothetical protein
MRIPSRRDPQLADLRGISSVRQSCIRGSCRSFSSSPGFISPSCVRAVARHPLTIEADDTRIKKEQAARWPWRMAAEYTSEESHSWRGAFASRHQPRPDRAGKCDQRGPWCPTPPHDVRRHHTRGRDTYLTCKPPASATTRRGAVANTAGPRAAACVARTSVALELWVLHLCFDLVNLRAFVIMQRETQPS